MSVMAPWAAFEAGWQAAASVLSFSRLRSVNVHRCEDVFHKLGDWSTTDWSVALGGEIGEAVEALGKLLVFLDTAKKLRRLDGADASKDTAQERDRLIDKIAEEAADCVIYADLLTASLGRDLGDAVVKKFNEVSVKRGSNVLL